jgi:hypothetical protein
MNYLDLDLLENPYGKRVGGGYDTVRVGSGGRLHIQGRDGGPLCMQGRKRTDLRASTGRVVDCYRCIKILAMESNAPYIRRELTTAKGEKKSHFMVPGGRQGQLVADKKASPAGMDGVAPFKRGPTQHPTQPWMTKRVAMAKSYAERLSDEGVALPPYLLPPTVEEMEAAQEFSYYASPKAKRRAAAAARRSAREAAASEVAQVANPYMVLSNPNGRVHARHGLPYMTFGNPAVPYLVVLHEFNKSNREEERRQNAYEEYTVLASSPFEAAVQMHQRIVKVDDDAWRQRAGGSSDRAHYDSLGWAFWVEVIDKRTGRTAAEYAVRAPAGAGHGGGELQRVMAVHSGALKTKAKGGVKRRANSRRSR